MVRQMQANLDEGMVSQLYRLASVPSEEVLAALRAEDIKVYTPEEVLKVPTELLDPVADKQLKQVQRRGAFYGGTFGMGGLLSVAPELAYMFVTVIRMAQKLSLTYGQEYESSRGRLELWAAIGRSVGIKLDLEGLETDLYRELPIVVGKGPFRDPILFKVAQKVLVTIGFTMSTRISRLVPFLGAGVGIATTYAYLSKRGRLLKEDFRTKHQLQHLNLSDPGLSEEISYTLASSRG